MGGAPRGVLTGVTPAPASLEQRHLHPQPLVQKPWGRCLHALSPKHTSPEGPGAGRFSGASCGSSCVPGSPARPPSPHPRSREECTPVLLPSRHAPEVGASAVLQGSPNSRPNPCAPSCPQPGPQKEPADPLSSDCSLQGWGRINFCRLTCPVLWNVAKAVLAP